jgi:hypothetical protein
MGRRKERRLAAKAASGRRVKLDLFLGKYYFLLLRCLLKNILTPSSITSSNGRKY